MEEKSIPIILKLNGSKMPTRGSKYSAGLDLYSCVDCVVGK